MGKVLCHNLVAGVILARNARKFPERLAVVDGARRLTYHAFHERVNCMANRLKSVGISHGDRIAILLFNSLEMAEIYFASAKLGAITVPVNPRLAAPEIQFIVEHSGAKALVFDALCQGAVRRIKEHIQQVSQFIVVGKTDQEEQDYETFLGGGTACEPMEPVTGEDPMLVLYTAGTTGKPKGAVLTHQNMIVNAIDVAFEARLQPGDIHLCPVPLSHSAAFCLFLAQVYLAGTTVMVRAFDPSEVTELMAREKVSTVYLVPPMWSFLLKFPGLAGRDVSSLRVALSGGAMLSLPLKRRMMEVFRRAEVCELFGQTEMSSFTCILKAEEVITKDTSIGRPLLNVEVRLEGKDGSQVPSGQVGEIVYCGPTVMQGYYLDPEATATAMQDGWFYSGDLAQFDNGGYLYLVDRKKDMVVTGGEHVYPAEIEQVLYHHPQVLEAAVIGVPHARLGEAVHAVIVLRSGAKVSAEEITTFCAEHLAGFKQPWSVEFVAYLPRNAAGKILKNRLREKYLAR